MAVKKSTAIEPVARTSTVNASSSTKFGLSTFAVIWLVVSGLICIIDATFVLLRPATLPGGSLDVYPYKFWAVYIEHDKRYAALEDAFVSLQSVLNLVELALQFVIVFLNARGRHAAAHKLCILVSVATLYKTVIYFGMEIFDGFPFTKHNSQFDLVTMVIIPSSFWIIIPAWVAYESLSKLGLKGKQE